MGRREVVGGEPERGWVCGQTSQNLVGHSVWGSWLFLGRIKTDSYKPAWNKKQLHLKNGFAMIYRRRVSIIQAHEDITLLSNQIDLPTSILCFFLSSRNTSEIEEKEVQEEKPRKHTHKREKTSTYRGIAGRREPFSSMKWPPALRTQQ